MSGLISLDAIRGNIERQNFESVPDETVLALIEVVEAAQKLTFSSIFCPAGHLDTLELALAKFEDETEGEK